VNYFFLGIALIMAFLDWAAVGLKWKTLRYITKPGVIILILVWLGSNKAFFGPMLWFSAGLVFSLVGDILLVLPREPFIPALLAFLLAHISYIIGFNSSPPLINFPGIILILIVLVSGIQIFRSIITNMASDLVKKLRIPLLAYTLVISIMLLSALSTLIRPEPPSPGGWNALPALLVSAGAMLFFLSDTSLAWNKFVNPFPYANLIVMITYHLGQLGIIIGATQHFLT
jgi:uncharacterized membrane protein YhhN